jgi:ABC-2 type transport system permease protein
MRIVADCNPVNWALEAARAALSTAPDWGRVFAQGGGQLALAVAVTVVSGADFRAYQQSV